jgi:hypothetical protein
MAFVEPLRIVNESAKSMHCRVRCRMVKRPRGLLGEGGDVLQPGFETLG